MFALKGELYFSRRKQTENWCLVFCIINACLVESRRALCFYETHSC